MHGERILLSQSMLAEYHVTLTSLGFTLCPHLQLSKRGQMFADFGGASGGTIKTTQHQTAR